MKYKAALIGALLLPLEANSADLLTLYQQATQTDPQVRAARATRDATREAKPQAMANLLPNVSASGDLSYQDQDVKSSPTRPAGYQDDFSSNSLTLNVVQPLFYKDRMVALKQADDQVEQADADYENAQQGLILRVAQAYFNVLSAKDTLTFAQAEKKAISRQLDQAQERFDVGLVAITDVHEAQARFDQSRANEISAINEVDNAVEALREIVAEAGHDLDGLREDTPLVPPQPAGIDDWSSTAQQQNPRILSAKLATEIARKAIDIRRAGHYPTLDLVGSLNRTRSNATFGTDVDTATIGLQVMVPLYTGGAVDSATREAGYRFEAAQENLDAERRAVARQVRDAYRGIETSISRVQALKATEWSAQSALEATEAGFDAGTRTLVDVLNSQRDLFRAKRDYAQSRYDYVLNTLSLLQAAGTLSEEDVKRVDGWLE